MEWYEEPITIVGFVAAFLLLVLVVASVLILCHSNDNEDEEQSTAEGANNSNGKEIRRDVETTEEDTWDITNPLYMNANEFYLQPLPRTLRANFVHIHVEGQLAPRANFNAYYNEAK